MKPSESSPIAAYDQAPHISIVEGEIVLLGVGRAGFSMTLKAARETSARLVDVLARMPDGAGQP